MEANPYTPPQPQEPRVESTIHIVPGRSRTERTSILVLGLVLGLGSMALILTQFGNMAAALLVIPLGILGLTWWWWNRYWPGDELKQVRLVFSGRPALLGGPATFLRGGWRTEAGYLFVTDREIVYCRRPLGSAPEEVLMPVRDLAGFAGQGLGLVSRSGRLMDFSVGQTPAWREALTQVYQNREGAVGQGSPVFQLVERQVSGSRILSFSFLMAIQIRRLSGWQELVGWGSVMALVGWGLYEIIRKPRVRRRVLARLPVVEEQDALLLGGGSGAGVLYLSRSAVRYHPGGRAGAEDWQVIALKDLTGAVVTGGQLRLSRTDGGVVVLPVDQPQVWRQGISAALKRTQ